MPFSDRLSYTLTSLLFSQLFGTHAILHKILRQKLKSATAAASADRPGLAAPDGPSTTSDLKKQSSEDSSKTQVTTEKEARQEFSKSDEARLSEGVIDAGQGEDVQLAQEATKPEAKSITKPETPIHLKSKSAVSRGLLLELLQGFRAGMLRVESNLRAAMFRGVRYLVRMVAPSDEIYVLSASARIEFERGDIAAGFWLQRRVEVLERSDFSL